MVSQFYSVHHRATNLRHSVFPFSMYSRLSSITLAESLVVPSTWITTHLKAEPSATYKCWGWDMQLRSSPCFSVCLAQQKTCPIHLVVVVDTPQSNRQRHHFEILRRKFHAFISTCYMYRFGRLWILLGPNLSVRLGIFNYLNTRFCLSAAALLVGGWLFNLSPGLECYLWQFEHHIWSCLMFLLPYAPFLHPVHAVVAASAKIGLRSFPPS